MFKLMLDDDPEALYTGNSDCITACSDSGIPSMGNTSAGIQLWKREQNEVAAEAGLNPFRKVGGTPTG